MGRVKGTTMSNDRESWRPIPGWENFYEVSDLGRVRSVNRTIETRPGVFANRRGRVLTPSLSPDGYAHVWLCRGNRRTFQRVSRAVATAWHGPCPKGMECRHLDGDKTNNTPANLAWGSRSENTHDKVRHGTHPMARKTHCKRGHPLSGPNVYMINGGRRCRTCVNQQKRDRRARIKHERKVA
ncbi:NUMOD4 motif-containing protein [Gordonia malaquae]|nr:NUMOD4 motif-containing protein [Gordonia malaquae]